jgi:hypothetical protein
MRRAPAAAIALTALGPRGHEAEAMRPLTARRTPARTAVERHIYATPIVREIPLPVGPDTLATACW